MWNTQSLGQGCSSNESDCLSFHLFSLSKNKIKYWKWKLIKEIVDQQRSLSILDNFPADANASEKQGNSRKTRALSSYQPINLLTTIAMQLMSRGFFTTRSEPWQWESLGHQTISNLYLFLESSMATSSESHNASWIAKTRGIGSRSNDAITLFNKSKHRRGMRLSSLSWRIRKYFKVNKTPW